MTEHTPNADSTGEHAVYYPAMLDLRGRTVLVVGGGEVARRKAESLATAQAGCIRVVAPIIDQSIAAVAGVDCRPGPYTADALDGVSLAIAATDDAAVNRLVLDDCRARGIWCNVVDVPELCDFIVPSVLRRGPLVIAVSTSGASPGTAKQIRRELEEQFGPAYGDWLAALARAREVVRRSTTDEALRRRVFRRLGEGDVMAAAEESIAGLRTKISEVLRDFDVREDA